MIDFFSHLFVLLFFKASSKIKNVADVAAVVKDLGSALRVDVSIQVLW